jgi:hypothetical protein
MPPITLISCLCDIIDYLDLSGNIVDPILFSLSYDLKDACSQMSITNHNKILQFVAHLSHKQPALTSDSNTFITTSENHEDVIDWIICIPPTNIIAEIIVKDFLSYVQKGMIIQVDDILMELGKDELPDIYKSHMPDCCITTPIIGDSNQTKIWLVWFKCDQQRSRFAQHIDLF